MLLIASLGVFIGTILGYKLGMHKSKLPLSKEEFFEKEHGIIIKKKSDE